MDDMEDGGDDMDQMYSFPKGSFCPGKVVWAKVEGHDWWPARVVRRRAVPREVGAPPGGVTEVNGSRPLAIYSHYESKDPQVESGSLTP